MINAEEGDEITVLLDPYFVEERGSNLGRPYEAEGCRQYTGKFFQLRPAYVCKLEMADGYIIFDYDDATQLKGPVT